MVRSDALRLPLRDESVDLVVTSPPYFALRSYRDGGEHYDGQIGSEPTPEAFLEALWAVTEECKRVLRPSGSMFVNLGDKYAGSGGHNNSSLAPPRTGDFGKRKHNKQAPRVVNGGGAQRRASQRDASRRNAPDAYNKATIGGARTKSLMGLPWRYAIGCTDQLHLILRAEIIWSKPNGLPESAADRVHRRHEQWFHLTKEPTYHADIDAVREPYADPTSPERSQLGKTRARLAEECASTMGGGIIDWSEANPLGKVPGSVWTVATQPLHVPDWLDVDHFAAFPQEWPRRFILGWCPEGGVVLDPFGGTGTTAMVARALGRYGVSVDLSADYLRLARWRIFDSDGASKVRAKTNGDRQGVLL